MTCEQPSKVTTLYGASSCLYGGTHLGHRVEGCSMVRRFDVVSETARSYVLMSGAKVPKAKMVYRTSSFDIAMFFTQEEAVNSLKSSQGH